LHTDRIILSKEISKKLWHETVLDILLGFFKIIEAKGEKSWEAWRLESWKAERIKTLESWEVWKLEG